MRGVWTGGGHGQGECKGGHTGNQNLPSYAEQLAYKLWWLGATTLRKPRITQTLSHVKLLCSPACCGPPHPTPQQVETLVGVMSERALDALISSGGKFNMASNW